jgi:hypothetical protein
MRSLTWHRPRRTGALALCVLVAGFTLLASAALRGQEQFRFFVLATDGGGDYVTDLTPAEIHYSESGQPGEIVSVEPFSRPVKLTLVIDNGSSSTQVMGNFRTGLEGFFKELPEDVEVTVISTAPQPRTVLRPTTERAQILQGVNRVGLDSERARFSDALYEYSQRIGKEQDDSLPVLLMLTTTGEEATSLQPAQLEQGLKTLIGRGARVYVLNVVSQQNNTTALEQLDRGRQKIIGEMYAGATGGHYEGVTVHTQIHDMLPGLGALLAQMHRQHTSQVAVTVKRPASGPLEDLDIRLTRPGLQGSVTGDGRIR